MCSGKTTTAIALSKLMEKKYCDLDDYIVDKYKLSINQFFFKYGEQYFRNIETDSLRLLIKENKYNIISCGGGTPCFNNNLLLMQKSGEVIYLKLSAETLANRIENYKVTRPLVNNLYGKELLNFVKEQLKEREKYYLLADVIIKADNLSPEEIAKLIFYQ